MINIENIKKIKPINSYAFKRIFGKVGNEEITKSLLNIILDNKIERIELDCNTTLEKDIFDEKMGILDIKAKLNNNTIYNIEIQIIDKRNIEKKLLYYWSKLYISGMKEEGRLRKTILILIADFELDILKENNEYHTKWKIQESEHRGIVLTNAMELHIIQLPKINYSDTKEDNKLLNWLKFIKNPEILEKEDIDENKELKKAKEEYEKFNQDEKERYIADLRDRYIREKNTAYTDGVEDGKIEIAKKLLKERIEISKISEITEISETEIKKLNQ